MKRNFFGRQNQQRPRRPGRSLAFLLWMGLIGGAASVASASEWFLYSPRAISLGGAYSALATGPDALLWNPAGLSYPSRFSLGFNTSGFLDDSEKMGDQLDVLRRVNPNDPFLYSSPGRTTELADQLFDLDGATARDFEQSSYLVSGDGWALGYTDLQNWALTAVTDEDRVLPADPLSEPASIALNQTSIDAYQFHLKRFSASLAVLRPEDPFQLGVTLHYQRGGVRFVRTRIFDVLDSDPEKLMRLAEDGERDHRDDFSMDVGLMIPAKNMRIAVVARNLFDAEFPTIAPPVGVPEDLKLGPQVRIGVAYTEGQGQNLPSQTVSIDLDVTNNRVLGGDRKTRALSVGYERALAPWLVVRSGTSRVFDDDLGFIFALGTGVRLSVLTLDLGGRINRSGGFDEIVGGATVSF